MGIHFMTPAFLLICKEYILLTASFSFKKKI